MRPPLVFVPGFPGSSLELRARGLNAAEKIFPPSLSNLLSPSRKARILSALAGPDDPDADDGVEVRSPIRYSIRIPILDLGQEAQSLYDLLEDRFGYDTEHGDDFRAVGWDWRRRIDTPATLDRLESAIEDLAQRQQRPVVVLAHSTGGLVLRALLEARPAVASKVEAILALGVPWAGVVKAFRILHQGHPIGPRPFRVLGARESKAMFRRAHAAYDILPPDPLRTDLADTVLCTVRGVPTSPLIERGWLGAEAREPGRTRGPERPISAWGRANALFDLGVTQRCPPIWNLVGWGTSTDTSIELEDGDNHGRNRRRPTIARSSEGDGTVPTASADWLRGPDVVTHYLPVGVYGDQLATQKHSQLWRTPSGAASLGRVLDPGASSEPHHAWAAVDADDAIDRRRRVRVRVTLADERGAPLPGGRAELRIPGQTAGVPLDARVRGEISFSRSGLHPNVGGRFYRFVVRFSWGMGRTIERPLLIE